MTYEQIAGAVQKQDPPVFEIRFKSRASVKGLFIKAADYNELKLKNFWRIVDERRIAEYEKTGNEDLARIFYGDGFLKLVTAG
ncbi:hypothetical protein [Niabella beijingensis]|uniref:hypothetical protein n=1 Tax=Niabella beijingensis TaxID=2872700 RepID=UPI001CC127CB|nr:hypothetical protein [Niabella beijingensis]MBZ4192539.1 hypothetical protein [Niabella beijingensis]